MNKTFWVTLRNVPFDTAHDASLWLQERSITTERNAGRTVGVSGYAYDYTSFCFDNDDDAMLFKLTFSNYL
jgi:hypothetical protein